MVEARSNNNVVYRCAYHVVWCPKYRRPVIEGTVDARLKQIIREVHEAVMQWPVIAAKVGVSSVMIDAIAKTHRLDLSPDS